MGAGASAEAFSAEAVSAATNDELKAVLSNLSPAQASSLARLQSASAAIATPMAKKKESAAEGEPSIELLLEQATSTKAAFGPLLLQATKLETQLKELQDAFDSNSDWASGAEFRIEKTRESLAEVRKKVDRAKERLTELRVQASERIGKQAAGNALAYKAAIEAADVDGGRSKFTEAAQRVVNTGELGEGQLVRVQYNGAMCKAKVLQKVEADSYELSLWTYVIIAREQYEEGYKTRRPIKKVYTRSLIYANQKQSQTLSAAPADVKNTDIRFLTYMLSDAEASNQRLYKLGPQIAARVNVKLGRQAVRALNSSLKKTPRINEKVAEKYDGNFAEVCDVARMTFDCDDFVAAIMTLEEVDACDDVDVTLIKDRMMVEYDAKESGGYCDALLNVRDRANGHIVEMQITLSALLAIKSGGGHAEYKLTRVLDLNEETLTKYSGVLTPYVIKLVRCGVIKDLVSKKGLKEHFDELVAALAAPSCLVHRLLLGAPGSREDWPKDKLLKDLLTAEVVAQLSPRLVHLAVYNACGDIPEELYLCTQLTCVEFEQSGVSGAVSPSIGKLVNLTNMWLWGTNMSGPFPTELGELKKLHTVQLHDPYTRIFFCGGKNGPGVWGPSTGEPYASFEAGLARCVSKYGWDTTAAAAAAWHPAHDDYEDSTDDDF